MNNKNKLKIIYPTWGEAGKVNKLIVLLNKNCTFMNEGGLNKIQRKLEEIESTIDSLEESSMGRDI